MIVSRKSFIHSIKKNCQKLGNKKKKLIEAILLTQITSNKPLGCENESKQARNNHIDI